MKYLLMIALLAGQFLLIQNVCNAYPQYTGYSGSPGRQACSISCHHRRSFAPTITVSGFPQSYVPGQQYTIAVGHNGGSNISQFNSSVRVGAGSVNAGIIAAGSFTTVYNVTGETNGVHFSSSNRASGDFRWTAPAPGTGTVKLYLAALQGSLSSGADTQIVLTSSENVTGIEEEPVRPQRISLLRNYPNPFNSETTNRIWVGKSRTSGTNNQQYYGAISLSQDAAFR